MVGERRNILHARDGERHAVEGDRAFVDRAGTEVAGQPQPHAPLSVGSDFNDLGKAIDMAEDDVAAEKCHRRGRMLEVDAIANAQAAEASDGERLRDDIEMQRRCRDVGDGETAAVDRDRGAEIGAMRPVADVDFQASCARFPIRNGADGGDAAERLHKSGEHGARIPNPPPTNPRKWNAPTRLTLRPPRGDTLRLGSKALSPTALGVPTP